MPAIYAHYMFGAESLPHFSEPVARIVRTHRAYFDLGLQGPDFYFFDQRLMLKGKHYARLGGELHKGSCVSLLSALEGGGGRRPENWALAYLFGLVGHFALDQAAHPHIEPWVKELGYNHHRLETEFDRFLLTRVGKEARCFPLGQCIHAPRRMRVAIGGLYEAAGLGDARDVAALFHDFGWIKNHTTLRRDKSYAALRALMQPFGAWDAIGGIFMGPKDELSEITNPRLFGIFEEAQGRYVQLTENYWRHIFEGAPLDAYFDRNFETAPKEEMS